MPESDGLTLGHDQSADPRADDASPVVGPTEDDLLGPDRGGGHLALYVALFTILVLGSVLLRGDIVYETGYTAHSVMEAMATVLAFIVGALALVPYYSRKQITFLLIGCGFRGRACSISTTL